MMEQVQLIISARPVRHTNLQKLMWKGYLGIMIGCMIQIMENDVERKPVLSRRIQGPGLAYSIRIARVDHHSNLDHG